MKFLSPLVHGMLDYLLAALFLGAPYWLNLASPLARSLCLLFGGGLLLVSLLTRYPLGLLRLVPFPVHGGIEFIGAVTLLASPWLAGFADVDLARNFFLGTGVALFAVWLITDYKAAELARVGAVRHQSRPQPSPPLR